MKDYHSSHMVVYDPPDKIGFLSLPILQFLVGHPWDQLALNFVHAVRPCAIRVIGTGGCKKTDARQGRVTVLVLGAEDRIVSISQECSVGLEPDYEHGHHLWLEARKRGML